jgi:hypothetical protein
MTLSPGRGDVEVADSVQRAVRATQLRAEWSFRLYPDAFEGGGSWVTARRADTPRPAAGHGADQARSLREAARRARSSMRRYLVANRCDRMITLTYAEACHDRDQFVADMRGFWLDLRAALGGTPRPYLWVPEWHKSHGLHAHAGVAEYIPFQLIREVWGHGRVRIERMAGAPIGHARAVVAERARICARYLGKYLGKDVDDTRRVLGRHRYDVAQGFQPASIILTGRSRDDVLRQACEHMNGKPERLWFSPEDADFIALWASWRAA